LTLVHALPQLVSRTLCLIILAILSAASFPVVANPAPQQNNSGVAHAARVDHAPRLDGTLGDTLWQSAQPITEFFQREPYEGQPPTEKTEVRILYSRNEIY